MSLDDRLASDRRTWLRVHRGALGDLDRRQGAEGRDLRRTRSGPDRGRSFDGWLERTAGPW